MRKEALGLQLTHNGPFGRNLEEPLLREAGVLAFAPRVTLSIAPDLDPMFPRSVPARITVTTARGVYRQSVLAPRGEPVNPLGEDDLLAKFATIARRRLACWRRTSPPHKVTAGR